MLVDVIRLNTIGIVVAIFQPQVRQVGIGSALYLATEMGPPSLVILFTVIVLLYMVYRWLRLPPFPVGRCRQFVERSRAGPIAHRAGRPENTLAGIRRAEQEGAPGVEVDLAFTKDSVAVLLHDKTVDRTSNGSGKLLELTFEEVRKLNFGNDRYSLVECVLYEIV